MTYPGQEPATPDESGYRDALDRQDDAIRAALFAGLPLDIAQDVSTSTETPLQAEVGSRDDRMPTGVSDALVAAFKKAYTDAVIIDHLGDEDATRAALAHVVAYVRQRADRAEAANGRVNALHSPYRIYESCGHQEHEPGTQVVELGDDETCLIIPTLIVCRECCTDDEGQTAHCVDNHDHSNGWLCATLAALDEPEAHHGDEAEETRNPAESPSGDLPGSLHSPTGPRKNRLPGAALDGEETDHG